MNKLILTIAFAAVAAVSMAAPSQARSYDGDGDDWIAQLWDVTRLGG